MLHVQVQLVYFYVIADLQKGDILKKNKFKMTERY